MDINLVANLSKDYTNVKVTIEAPEMNDDIKMMVDIIESFSNSKKNLISYSDGKKYILSTNDILYFYSESKKNYCKTENGIYQVKEKLYELENTLNNNFVRISSSCIINLNYIKCFESAFSRNIEVVFKDNSVQYVSRGKVKEVLKKIKEWT
ncbi:MAG: LytTR family transcriptional regulator [Clostridia bacterium]|nr:LytTR family transcriptional regulator [Clostridia bacterium]